MVCGLSFFPRCRQPSSFPIQGISIGRWDLFVPSCPWRRRLAPAISLYQRSPYGKYPALPALSRSASKSATPPIYGHACSQVVGMMQTGALDAAPTLRRAMIGFNAPTATVPEQALAGLNVGQQHPINGVFHLRAMGYLLGVDRPDTCRSKFAVFGASAEPAQNVPRWWRYGPGSDLCVARLPR